VLEAFHPKCQRQILGIGPSTLAIPLCCYVRDLVS